MCVGFCVAYASNSSISIHFSHSSITMENHLGYIELRTMNKLAKCFLSISNFYSTFFLCFGCIYICKRWIIHYLTESENRMSVRYFCFVIIHRSAYPLSIASLSKWHKRQTYIHTRTPKTVCEIIRSLAAGKAYHIGNNCLIVYDNCDRWIKHLRIELENIATAFGCSCCSCRRRRRRRCCYCCCCCISSLDINFFLFAFSHIVHT